MLVTPVVRLPLTHLSWPPAAQLDDVFATDLRQRLEGAQCIALLLEDSDCLKFLSRILLESNRHERHELGVEVLTLTANTSETIVLRRDLHARLKPLRAWQNCQQRYNEAPDEARTALTHSLFEALDSAFGSMRVELRFADGMLVNRLQRLQTLELNDETDVSSAEKARLTGLLRPLLQRSGSAAPEIERLRARTRSFWHFLAELGITDRSLGAPTRFNNVRRTALRRLAWMLPLLPLGAWGIINHYILFKIPDWFAFWRGSPVKHPNLWRLVCLPFAYIAQFFLFERLVGSAEATAAAFVYLTTLPLFGFAGLALLENRSRIWDDFALLALLRQPQIYKTTLMNMRWEILESLAAITEEGGHGSRSKAV